jgi:hypothetical protein
MELGFIGLGVMGRPMAVNLIKGGHDMNVYARRAESAAPLVAAGARLFDSPAEVAAHSTRSLRCSPLRAISKRSHLANVVYGAGARGSGARRDGNDRSRSRARGRGEPR